MTGPPAAIDGRRRSILGGAGLWGGFALLAAGLVTLMLGLMWLEPNFIYFPMKYPAGNWALASRQEPGDPVIEDVYLTASDGVRLHGWYARGRNAAAATPSQSPPVVLILHGNAGNVTHRYEWMRGLTHLGAEVFVLDYRGFGRSQGRPSETGLYTDAQAAWDYLVQYRGVEPGRIVLLGESLGGGVAVELAARVKPAGLIVQSSFTSVPDVARYYLPWLPRFLVRTQMPSVQRIKQVPCAKLFIHSRDDQIIPFALGRRLYEAAGEPREFLELRGVGHNETYFAAGYYERVASFIRHALAGPTSTGPLSLERPLP